MGPLTTTRQSVAHTRHHDQANIGMVRGEHESVSTVGRPWAAADYA